MSIFQISILFLAIVASGYVFYKFPDPFFTFCMGVGGVILTLIFVFISDYTLKVILDSQKCSIASVFLVDRLGCGAVVMAASYSLLLASIYGFSICLFRKLIGK